MKYIRTKDGRIIVKGEETDKGYDKGVVEIHSYCGVPTLSPIGDIVKESNTIEELCDDFVVIGYEKILRPQIIYGQNIKKFYQNNKNYCDIYGAIWTEWGLKYVAKMNEEGELELI